MLGPNTWPQLEREEPVLGARLGEGYVRFGAFTTTAVDCRVRLYDEDGHAQATYVMSPVESSQARGQGYFAVDVPDIGAGALYKLVLDTRALPDPYARFLPRGVHGPAMVVDERYAWRSPLRPAPPAHERIIYELHVGTFSPEGTFDGAVALLPALVALGVTVVELMPVGAFDGARGWGYDGVAWFAPFAPYGTPEQLRALVDACHRSGLSVILDVVYNHVGPAGNYLREFSPDYFTSQTKNAWGDSLDYGHPVVRRMIVDNALYWLDSFHFDGLRLDATHAIVDHSSRHILSELCDTVAALHPERILIAEDDRNDSDCVTALGLDAVWADDFHHAVRVTVTGEQEGYFAAYVPGAATIAETINNGWLYRGQAYPLTGKPRGKTTWGLDAERFVYCIQNHDQIGNRAFGDRLSAVVSADMYRALSMLLLFLPMTPLLFMGQEWAATTPFLYFTDHNHDLGPLIAQGRRNELKSFSAFADPSALLRIPDPQQPSTFERSRLCWDERRKEEGRRTLELYRAMIALRKSDVVLSTSQREGLSAAAASDLLCVTRTCDAGTRVLVVNFGRDAALPSKLVPPESRRLLLASNGLDHDGEPLGPATANIWSCPSGS